jgi:hypothetical protein
VAERDGKGDYMTDLYFADQFDVDPALLDGYGAFNISVVSDLPLFIDPFLLFNSDKPEYQTLHQQIIDYLLFLKDKSQDELDDGIVQSWFRFKEVKQNWLGFTVLGNEGQGLGAKFARSLNAAFRTTLHDFGDETITTGSHLEKVCLIRGGVGRDNISDFTTNLIKEYLLDYTEEFARAHLDPSRCGEFNVARAFFNYSTETWQSNRHYLPRLGNDFVLLTPSDMLTKDDTWISHGDMVAKFALLPEAVPNEQLRAQINNYFRSLLSRDAKERDIREAAARTIQQFPVLIDHYVRIKEDTGEDAVDISRRRVSDVDDVFVRSVQRALEHIAANSDINAKSWTSYDEALARARDFKHYVEHQDGYKVINRNGAAFSRETEVQLFFGLIWCNTSFDVNREPNNGRGPVDFKVSYGAGDKSLIEFKLGSSSSLKRNLEKQVQIYEAANRTHSSVKVIICYTLRDQRRVTKILKELGIENHESIVVVDARSDNKPSASTA